MTLRCCDCRYLVDLMSVESPPARWEDGVFHPADPDVGDFTCGHHDVEDLDSNEGGRRVADIRTAPVWCPLRERQISHTEAFQRDLFECDS